MRYALILLGGGVGSLTRYLTTTAILTRFGGRFPLGTFVINVSGSFLIGLIMTLLTERLPDSPYWRPLLVIGFLGGYTTFSSFEWEIYYAIRQGAWWIGFANMIGSVTLGYIAVWLGALVGRK